MIVAAINVGSTSLKFKAYLMPEEKLLCSGAIDRIGGTASTVSFNAGGAAFPPIQRHVRNQKEAVGLVLDFLEEQKGGDPSESLEGLDAVGFKTVHAGNEFGPVIIDERVTAKMQEFSDAAPLHNPAYIEAIRSFQERVPATPLVGVFETGFHRHIPDHAYMYSTPYAWYQEYGIRKYGFHGASLKFVSERAAELATGACSRVIICHLGGSSSICAVRDGVSVDTSMGFSPQAGILMSQRIGDIDTFVLPFVAKASGMNMDELFRQMAEESGLLGVSGLSADVRDLEHAREENPRADLALRMFSYSVRKYIGSYSAVLGGLDVLCFSGGIGEKSSGIRSSVCANLEYLGIQLDESLNTECVGAETRISADSSRVDVFVVPTNEEVVIARSVFELLGRGGGET